MRLRRGCLSSHPTAPETCCRSNPTFTLRPSTVTARVLLNAGRDEAARREFAEHGAKLYLDQVVAKKLEHRASPPTAT